jgi:hypothetical protein
VALTVHVETESGKIYTVDVHQGSLRRLVIPTGEEAVLEFVPHQKVDIGFGGAGQGGRLKVTGGVLGVVIDARGGLCSCQISQKNGLNGAGMAENDGG